MIAHPSTVQISDAERPPTSERTAVHERPASLLPSLHDIEFVCPLCHGELVVPFEKEAYYCAACSRSYELHGGIPDFRIFPDRFLTFQEDHERTEIVLAALERYELEPLLEHYWSFSDITPVSLRPKFVRSAMLGELRAQRALCSIESDTSNKTVRNVLEIGSGTGNFLALATSRYERVIGVDIAMRWLHLSRRRFMDRGLPVPALVCCCAEYLPFPDRSFDLIVAASTLEFLSDQDKALSECARTLGDSGLVYVNTVNRYSLSKDPYAYLWGVGFLPRAWQSPYVRWRRGASYEYIKTLSLSSLHRLAGKHFATRKVALPGVDRASMQHFPKTMRLQAQTYELLRTLPPFDKLLKWCGPGWDAMLHKGQTS
jgi:ubiquinone/menaquinone biosynthesis C-methylase UbiE/uncharacterized protein YbaR (Trm112 family)